MPGRELNEPFFVLKFCLETRLSSESLEPLIGFLAYLEPKLWLKNTLFDKYINFFRNVWFPSHGKFWPAITRQQIELESYSNPLKTREVF